MGLFATGVTVLTVRDGGGQVRGMTANAVTSVSLEPTLLLVCVGKQANIAPALLAAGSFSLSFLPEDRADLSEYFAGLWRDGTPPPGFAWAEWGVNAPRLDACLAAVACRTERVLDGGDHWIVIGEVVDLYHAESPGRPLIFFGGRYRRLMPDREEHT
jgi:flavin reductase (DIM6/NTAB) family NADH-FMN oxidoreductase RutF